MESNKLIFKVAVAPPPETCRLSFNTVNIMDGKHISGEIYLDGKLIGATPVSVDVKVEESYRVEARSLEYEFHKWSFESTQNPATIYVYYDWRGTERKIIAYFKPKGTYPVTLTIAAVVAGYPYPVPVYIDGEHVGETILEKTVSKCREYTVKVPDELEVGGRKYVFNYWTEAWTYRFRYENPIKIHIPVEATYGFNLTAHYKTVTP